MPIIGQQINLYLDSDGALIITQAKRAGLRPLDASRGFRLNAPLEGVVTAEVEMIVSDVEVTLPADQLKAMAICPSCGRKKEAPLVEPEPESEPESESEPADSGDEETPT